MITIAPGKHRMPKRRGVARAALSAAIQRPALTDPDWPLSGAGSQPRWYSSPLLHPDHPSAPVPRVRAPLVPGPGGAGRSLAPRPAHRRPTGQLNPGTADREAAHLRAVILSLSEQLSQMSAYLRENLAGPGGVATMPAPAIAPPRPRTAPSPRPRTTPADKPQARPRQYNAMRMVTAATATLLSFAVLTGATELGLHGFRFFVFRQTGTGETGQPDHETDQQFLAQQAAAAKGATSKPATQTTHRPGRHSANIPSGS